MPLLKVRTVISLKRAVHTIGAQLWREPTTGLNLLAIHEHVRKAFPADMSARRGHTGLSEDRHFVSESAHYAHGFHSNCF